MLLGSDEATIPYLMEKFNLGLFLPITLMEVSDRFGIPYSTIAQAAREGRIGVRREAGTWLTTEHAIGEAIRAGRLRPRGDAAIRRMIEY